MQIKIKIGTYLQSILSIEAAQMLSKTLKDFLLKYPVTHEEHVENVKKRYKD